MSPEHVLPSTARIDEILAADAGRHYDWPVTIAMVRYQGAYEGGRWAAWEALPEDVPEDAFGGDSECITYWDGAEMVGRGETPGDALADLRRRQGLGL